MKNVCLAFACLLLCVAGCYESLTDIATADKVVFYDEFVGEFKPVAPTTGRLVLEKGEDNAYAYTHYNAAGDTVSGKGSLWILKLGEQHFYQLSVDGYTTRDGKPVYGVGRLAIEGDAGKKTLTGYAFQSAETLFGDKLVTTAEYEQPGGQKSRAVQMPAEKFQEYLAARGAEMTEATMKFEQAAAAAK